MSSSRDDARKHINSFRAARGLTENDCANADNLNLLDLTHALALTSSELYADSFHFLWEVIQNNDDAAYDNEQPQLRFTLTETTLYAWSNQTGFSRCDVDSICGIGRSSKKAKPDAIGEKGIGFKSLFTVADRVTIHSEPYHFKFDTTTPLGELGMIVPTWVTDLTEVTNRGVVDPTVGTTVILHLKPRVNVASLKSEIKRLDFAFLLFCRRLKKLEVCFKSKHGYKEFSRSGELRDQAANTVTLRIKSSNQDQPKDLRFRLFSSELTNMPEQPQRPEQETSTVRLAFDLPENWSDGPANRMTYAFMPIKEYGFKFMMHANFLLTANRAEVIHSHEWNIRLRTGLANLIVCAIKCFAMSPDFRLGCQWLHYVGSLFYVTDSFFKPLAIKVCDLLKHMPLLETEANDSNFFQTIANAYFVGNDFRSDGKLILDQDGIARISLLEKYSKDREAAYVLQRLGVRTFDCNNFLCELTRTIKDEETAFRSKNLQWHASVAVVLLSGIRQLPLSFKSRCQELDLIPLNSGRWTKAKTAKLFLPGPEINDIPPSLTIHIAEATACSDKSRRDLFERLGVKTCTRQQICEAILAGHQNGGRKSVEESMQELKFLFLSNYRPTDQDRFNFFDQSGKSQDPRILTRIHIPIGSIGTAVKKQMGSAYPHLFSLHIDYARIPNDEQVESFAAWLKLWKQLYAWPDICHSHKLTSIMARLLAMEGSTALLAHFQLRLANNQTLPIYDDFWKRDVSDLEVSTSLGLRKLRETALPDVAKHSNGTIPSLNLPESTDQAWSFLQSFGVLTDTDARFFLEQLRVIKSSSLVASIDSKVREVYWKLGGFALQDELIRQAFESEDLIYLGDGKWTKSASCRWSADYVCTCFPLLSIQYGDCETLFKNIIGLKLADLNDLLAEYRRESLTTSSDEIDIDTSEEKYQLLLDMNKMLLVTDVSEMQKSEMQEFRMFPIQYPVSRSGETSICLQRSTDLFWVGDIESLQKTFYGKIPLLRSIEGTSVQNLNKVLSVVDIEDQKLTNCALSEVTSSGSLGVVDEIFTNFVKRKTPYIISILQHANETRDTQEVFVDQLRDLRIERVEGIKIRRYVQDGNNKKYGIDDQGEICLNPGPNELVVHVDPGLREPDIFEALSSHLSAYWNLQDENKQLLYKVIASTSPKRFTEAFERAGIAIPDDSASSNQFVDAKQTVGAGSADIDTTNCSLEFAKPLSSPSNGHHDSMQSSLQLPYRTQEDLSSQRNGDTPGWAMSLVNPQEEIWRKIGREGERVVYDKLSSIIGPTFNHHNWTSSARDEFYSTDVFTGSERDHADFTYTDTDGKLGEYITTKVPSYVALSHNSRPIKYHLEVKTSVRGLDVPVMLSHNQIEMAKRFSDLAPSHYEAHPYDMYVLVRVYDFKRLNLAASNIRFYPDPWLMVHTGDLVIDSEEGLRLRPPVLR